MDDVTEKATADESQGKADVTKAGAEQVPTQESSTNPTDETEQGSKQSESVNNAFGAVKKEAEKKGFEKGKQAGYDQAKVELTYQQNNNASNNQLTPQQQAEIHFYELKGLEVKNKGQLEYDDFSDKVNPIIEESKSDPELAHLLQTALTIGDHKMIYKIAKDEEFRNDLLDSNSRTWIRKLRNLHKSPASTPVNKNAEPPTESIRTTPTNGDKTLTFKENCARLKKHGRS